MLTVHAGFVSLNYEMDSQEASRYEVNYEMPVSLSECQRSYTIANRSLKDGTMVKISNHRFDGPEGYFKPSILGISSQTLPEAISAAISNVDYSLRRKMASNIILAGNSSLFNNMVCTREASVPGVPKT